MTTLITRDELSTAIEAGTVVVVDALGGDYYAQQHLPGAIALVESEVATRAAELLPDRHRGFHLCPEGGQRGRVLAAQWVLDEQRVQVGDEVRQTYGVR